MKCMPTIATCTACWVNCCDSSGKWAVVRFCCRPHCPRPYVTIFWRHGERPAGRAALPIQSPGMLQVETWRRSKWMPNIALKREWCKSNDCCLLELSWAVIWLLGSWMQPRQVQKWAWCSIGLTTPNSLRGSFGNWVAYRWIFSILATAIATAWRKSRS